MVEGYLYKLLFMRFDHLLFSFWGWGCVFRGYYRDDYGDFGNPVFYIIGKQNNICIQSFIKSTKQSRVFTGLGIKYTRSNTTYG